MSVQAAQDFISKVQSDAALKSKVDSASDVNAIVAIGASAGFSFTASEYQSAAGSAWSNQAEELSEADLEGVAGGGFADNYTTTATGATGGDCYTYACDGTTTTTKGNKNK